MLEYLESHRNLTKQESYKLMRYVISAPDLEICEFLNAFRYKNPTSAELTGFYDALMEDVHKIRHRRECMDIVGTGGGYPTLNASTAASIIVASAGIPIAKHGNRAVTSQCGSADVLEKLGIKIDMEPDDVYKMIEKTGFGFMLAPKFNPAFRKVARARKLQSYKGPTIFNLLGPLCNPVNPQYRIIGVYDKNHMASMRDASHLIGTRNTLIVNGGSMDEVSNSCGTVIYSQSERKSKYYLMPEMFGFERCLKDEIKSGTAEENANIIRDIFDGRKGPPHDFIVMNAGVALSCIDESNFEKGIRRAEKLIDSGDVRKKMKELVRYCSYL